MTGGTRTPAAQQGESEPMRQTMPRFRWAFAFGLAAATWAAGMVAGAAVAERAADWTVEDADPALAQAAMEQTEPTQIGEQTQPSKGRVFLFILGRNTAVYIWLLAGLLSAGAVTFVVLFYNGLQLGLTIALAQQAGVPTGAVTDLLLTHGVLEVGAFFVAAAVGFQGFRLALGWARARRESLKTLRLAWVLLFGLCALTGAAAIETLVTPQLARFHAVAME